MHSLFRELTSGEISFVAGGNYIPDWGWVVTGGRSGGGGLAGWGGGGGSIWGGGYDTGVDYSGGGGDMPSPGSAYPGAFDHALDDRIDALAAQIGAEIAAKPDADKYEYGAIIWKDANGNLHTTTIDRGTTNQAPTDKLWAQVDFAHGAEVVSILHSHPTLYNAGSVNHPNWQPATQASTLSAMDFDNLINRGSGSEAGFDSSNYRSYLVFGSSVTEYYAFEQDQSRVGVGGQATWAVVSTDYGQ